jgi:hypothetical protein
MLNLTKEKVEDEHIHKLRLGLIIGSFLFRQINSHS